MSVCAVLGLIGREGQILRKTWIPFLLYGVVAGAATFLLLACAPR